MPIYESEELDPLPPEPDNSEAWRAYRAGMRSFGTGLLALAVLQLIAIVVLAALAGPGIFVIPLLGGLAIVHFVAGLLLRREQHWMNYAMIVWGVVLALGYLTSLGMGDGAPVGVTWFVGVVIPLAFIAYSVQNLNRYKRATTPAGSGD